MGQSVIPVMIPIESAVERVLASAPIIPKRLFSSDLPRCLNLALGLAEAWGIELSVTSALREINFGSWEGRLYDDLDREDGRRWRAWCDDWKHRAPPGGETLLALTSRIDAWLQRAQPGRNTLLVTHAGVIRALEVLGGKSWDDAMATEHPFLEWHHHALSES